MSLTGVVVREMGWPDLPAVHALEVTAFPSSAWSLETYWAELAGVPATRSYWVAEDDSQVVGYVGLMTVPPQADIQTIAVDAAHRGEGIGARLLSTAIAEARRRECHSVMLEVSADNDAARVLYERAGFEQLARRPGYYGQGRDALIMRMRLNAGDEVGHS